MNAENKIKKALFWITDILEKHNIPFQIVGGLAVKAYGSPRPLVDIDIEIPEESFSKIQNEVSAYIIYGPAQLKEERWDLFLMTLNYEGQEVDISGAYTTKVYDILGKIWVTLNPDFSKIANLNLYGKILPIISKEQLIAYKKILLREVDVLDLQYLEKNN